MNVRALFRFRRPSLAKVAVGLTIFALVLALAPIAGVEKFGFQVGLGVGLYLVTTSGKAMGSQYGNLGVLLVYGGLASILAAVLATPTAVLAATALDDAVAPIMGAIGGLFTSIEQEE